VTVNRDKTAEAPANPRQQVSSHRPRHLSQPRHRLRPSQDY